MQVLPIVKCVHKLDKGLMIMEYIVRQWSSYASLVAHY